MGRKLAKGEGIEILGMEFWEQIYFLEVGRNSISDTVIGGGRELKC